MAYTFNGSQYPNDYPKSKRNYNLLYNGNHMDFYKLDDYVKKMH